MIDVDARGRHEAELLREEATRIADTESALQSVLADEVVVPLATHLGASTMLDLEPTIEPRGERHRSRFVVAAVLAAAAAAVIAVMVTLRDDTRPAEELDASDTAAAEELLAPPADLAGLAVTEAAHDQTAPGVIRAAVRTPSGEIIGITIHGGRLGGGGMGGSKTIAGRQISIGKPYVAGQLEDFWTYWGDSGDCFAIGITMSDGLETPYPFSYTPPDIETFFQQLTITDATGGTGGDGETVTIQLPPGWESLGTATVSDRYILQFSANVDTIDSEFELDQRPATGVGVFLADPGRTNPHPTTLSGRPAWLMTSTGGWNTLVFDDDGTAVALRARGLNEQQLVAFAATLERRPWGEASALLAGTNSTQTPVDEQFPERATPVRADCNVSLEIV